MLQAKDSLYDDTLERYQQHRDRIRSGESLEWAKRTGKRKRHGGQDKTEEVGEEGRVDRE